MSKSVCPANQCHGQLFMGVKSQELTANMAGSNDNDRLNTCNNLHGRISTKDKLSHSG